MGVLGLQGYLALLLGDATDGEGDGCVIIVMSVLVAGGHFSPLGSAKLPISATLARANNTPVPLRRQNHDMAL